MHRELNHSKTWPQTIIVTNHCQTNHSSLIGITEFRIFCTKKYHGRKFHVSTRKTPKGYQFRDYILGKEEKWLENPGDCSKAVKRLPGDDSYLVEACLQHPEYVMSQALGNKESRLYDHVLYEHGNLHVQLSDNARLECDDFQPKHMMNGYNQIGQWLYYVRWTEPLYDFLVIIIVK